MTERQPPSDAPQARYAEIQQRCEVAASRPSGGEPRCQCGHGQHIHDGEEGEGRCDQQECACKAFAPAAHPEPAAREEWEDTWDVLNAAHLSLFEYTHEPNEANFDKLRTQIAEGRRQVADVLGERTSQLTARLATVEREAARWREASHRLANALDLAARAVLTGGKP